MYVRKYSKIFWNVLEHLNPTNLANPNGVAKDRDNADVRMYTSD